MAILKSIVYVLVALAFIIFGLIFSFRNQELISVDLLFFEMPLFSIGFWILGSLIAGVLLGLILALPRQLFQSIRIKMLTKKQHDTNSPTVERVRAESSKGS